MGPIDTFLTVSELRICVTAWRARGLKIALVPTMGRLHQGHMELVRAAAKMADRVIATVFVNPTQFGAGEDLDAYPRDHARDTQLIATAGGHVVFIPSISEMYPPGFSTRVVVDGLTDVLCGQARPTHFDGVSQVVTKLLNQAQADVALFGEKDWQQLAVIRRLARDLDIDTEIKGVPTVRDEFGLALSSRNAYLSKRQIEVARKFNVVLKRVAAAISDGESSRKACEEAREDLLAYGFDKIDYVDCRDSVRLEMIDKFSGKPARIFGAVHLGRARLIDNHPV